MLLIANWKSHLDLVRMRTWTHVFLESLSPEAAHAIRDGQIAITICPPAPLAYPLKTLLTEYPITIGAQDISAHPEGSHTGEVSAEAYASIATQVLIGHQERRDLGDTEVIVGAKYARAYASHLQPILCIATPAQALSDAQIIAYEPAVAIGTGAVTTHDTIRSCKTALALPPQVRFLYGGSVNQDTIHTYLTDDLVDGFLCGSASLDPVHFAALSHILALHAAT